jgi:hypothetical protein
MTVNLQHPIVALANARMPKNQILDLPEVAVAIDEDASNVQKYCEAGEIDGFDAGTGGKARWRVDRTSVLEFLTARSMGIRRTATQRVPHQQPLSLGDGTAKGNQKNKGK